MKATTESAGEFTPDSSEEAFPITHLERDLELIRRYAFIHSNAPFRSRVPVLGPLVIAVKSVGRALVRRVARVTLGSQADFNSAVAEILFEFTRRAATENPLTLHDSALDEALRRLPDSPQDSAAVLALLARELQLFKEQARAAQLALAQNEQAVAELQRRMAELERTRLAK